MSVVRSLDVAAVHHDHDAEYLHNVPRCPGHRSTVRDSWNFVVLWLVRSESVGVSLDMVQWPRKPILVEPRAHGASHLLTVGKLQQVRSQ